MKLSYKFLLFNFLTKGLILLIFLVGAPLILEFFAYKATDQELRFKKKQVIQIIEEEGIQRFIADESLGDGFGSYNILKEEYVLIERVEGEDSPLDQIFSEERILEGNLVPYRVYAFIYNQNDKSYLIEIGRSLVTIEFIKSLLFQVLLIGLIIFLVLSGILDTFFTEQILRPFRWIIKNKLQVVANPNEVNESSVKTQTLEFLELDQSINFLMRRIQKAFYEERNFISQVSHELKTPISVLQLKFESLFDPEKLTEEQIDQLMDMQYSIQKMKKTVNALLLLSKVNNQQFLLTEEVDCQKVLNELLEEWEIFAHEKNVQFIVKHNQPLVVSNSNASLIEMMIRNAISNAVKYSEKGKEIVIDSGLSEGIYFLSIHNSTFGISDEVQRQVKAGKVFLKDASHDKSGFGLQIMFKVADYLKFSVEIESSKKFGTKVTFTKNMKNKKQPHLCKRGCLLA
jgi:signal transduction histidine kinase